jgi:Ca2+-dependent lipid-binding protein
LISGWQFPKTHKEEHKEKGEVIDPYVKIKMEGVSKDQSEVRTKTISKILHLLWLTGQENNGFNPVWNTEFKFQLTTPELAILMFTVMDEDSLSRDDFIAQYALNVYNIREGYRVIPLKDKKGASYDKASLLIHFSWEDRYYAC